MIQRILLLVAACAAFSTLPTPPLRAQSGDEAIHKRGRLWEIVRNDGYIGSAGAWDFLTSAPMGLYPGFEGYTHPVGSEFNAYPGVYVNANFHNFRSGVWIVAKDIQTPGPPPTFTPILSDYELYYAGMQGDAFGIEAKRDPIALTKNYQGSVGFDARLPEEQTAATWITNTGITVTRKSSVWSYPGYSDFIIYDYTFRNAGEMVSTQTGTKVSGFPAQRLSPIYIVFHSGIAVSTKSQINFHDNLDGVAAGGFGYVQTTFHDFYHAEDNGTLVYSTNYNGGAAPPPWDGTVIKSNESWKKIFGNELLSPSAFGWLALYASPATNPAKPRPRPEAPDVLRIDSHKGGEFPAGEKLDLERFLPSNRPKKLFYQFVTTPDTTGGGKLPNAGNRMNFYTQSYGPYTLQTGDSLRFIIAEIAGVLDYHDAIAGGNGNYPDSTIAAIRRNAAHARDAVKWGMGATINGIPLAADVPEPPPAPNTAAANASKGTDTAAIAVTWDKLAETTTLSDGMGNAFYHGAADLKGYRIYRSTDFQFVSQTQSSVLRGAARDLLVDISASQFAQYWDVSTNRYKFVDHNVQFGFRYGYYVQAYWQPSTWTSANGTVVTTLGELASGPTNMTAPAAAAPGPVYSMDVFVAPNPFVYGDPQRSFIQNGNPYGIEFRNLPDACAIRIYTLTGDLVRTLEHRPDAAGSVYGSEPWDQKSNSGLIVAPGLYVYRVTSTTSGLDKSFTGKLMIIR
jgi:hypothetical protein